MESPAESGEPTRVNVPETGRPSGRQSAELMGYLETLFRRMMLSRTFCESAAAECSKEELRALVMLGIEAPRTMGDLAQALDVPLSTATHTVSRLVDRKLVERVRSETDRRVVKVDLSDQGRRFQSELRKQRLQMSEKWLQPLSRGEREIFLELMGKITAAG